MVTAVPELDHNRSAQPKPVMDVSALVDRTPAWLRAPRILAAFTLALALVYCGFSYMPVWHTDVWGHLAYGRYIWNAGGLPATEPLMPLAQGMPFIDTAWLSQLIGYRAIAALGVPAIQFLYAASITLCVGLLAYRLYSRTKSPAVCVLAGLLFAWVEWQQILIVRPQLAGMACFLVLLTIVTAPRWSRANWFIVPALFALWANLHGSFIVGLGLLGAMAAGRAADLLRRTGMARSLRHDVKLRRLVLLTELAAVAALVNPYGLGLYLEVLTFSRHANLADLVEWEPLTLRMKQGQAAIAAALALVVLYRLSPRRVSVAEPLLLIGLGCAMLWTSRMIVWWGPLAAYYFGLHGHAVWRKWRGPAEATPSPANGRWAVVSLGIAWIAFAISPMGNAVLNRHKPAQEFRGLSANTPVGAVEYLRQHPPVGQMFNPIEWGDFLLWAGPPGCEVFVASHVHMIPTEVWQTYFEIANVGSGWDESLDRYGVNTVVVDHARRDGLISKLRADEHWRIGYEDNVAVVFLRKKAIE